MSEPPIPVEPVIVTGWVDAVAAAEADAIAYTDEQVPIIAGRMVPRNMDRAPLVEDGAELLDGTGWNEYDPVTGDLVQMWRWDGTAWQALDMAAQMIPVLDIGSATVGDLTGGRINVTDGPIVAGTPGGARVELTGDGLHAYDGTGTETARIQGEGGEFVGGEFRTSDTLAGQVTLSDTASQGGPGLSIEPGDSTGYDALPSIGPDATGMHVRGGVSTDGSLAGAAFSPGKVSLYQNGPGANGSGAWADVSGAGARLTYRPDRTGPNPEVFIDASPDRAALGYSRGEFGAPGHIRNLISVGENEIQLMSPGGLIYSGISSASVNYNGALGDGGGSIEAHAFYSLVEHTANGVSRSLTVDADGVWVKSGAKAYNLEETAQDSGWQGITLAAGLAGGWSPAWRNKGGVIYMRGRVTKTGDWTTGWNVLATDVGADARPASHIQRAGATRGAGATFLEVTTAGVLQVWFDASAPGTTTVELSPMFYPLG